jgi:hypothetical protein
MNLKTKYFYPIILKNKKINPFNISPNVELRQLTTKEREDFFGLKKVDFTFSQKFPDGYIDFNKFVPSNRKSRCPYTKLFERGLFDGSSDILASNYVLIIECSNTPDFLLERLNLSFKLFKPTSTGGYVGFEENETDVHFHYYMPIHGPFDYLHLKKNDLEKIKEIYSSVEKNKDDDKFKFWSELYSRSLQGDKTGIDLRFLLLIFSLESLYLPKRETELGFRLSIRLANLLSKYRFGKSEDIYKQIREIYKVRSELVHNGKTNKLTSEIYSELTNFVRISLNLYLKDRNLFSKKYLTDIQICRSD